MLNFEIYNGEPDKEDELRYMFTRSLELRAIFKNEFVLNRDVYKKHIVQKMLSECFGYKYIVYRDDVKLQFNNEMHDGTTYKEYLEFTPEEMLMCLITHFSTDTVTKHGQSRKLVISVDILSNKSLDWLNSNVPFTLWFSTEGFGDARAILTKENVTICGTEYDKMIVGHVLYKKIEDAKCVTKEIDRIAYKYYLKHIGRNKGYIAEENMKMISLGLKTKPIPMAEFFKEFNITYGTNLDNLLEDNIVFHMQRVADRSRHPHVYFHIIAKYKDGTSKMLDHNMVSDWYSRHATHIINLFDIAKQCIANDDNAIGVYLFCIDACGVYIPYDYFMYHTIGISYNKRKKRFHVAEDGKAVEVYHHRLQQTGG